MRINRIEIANFGKFSNYNLDFEDDFQIIYGDNEDGKSTIMAFIEMMFYGDQGRARTLERNNRLKYRPWNGAAMEGAVLFEHHDTPYRLQKVFGDTLGTAGDTVEIINLATNTSVPLEAGKEVGTHFFGLDLEGFRRSSFIGQVGRIEVAGDRDMVAERLLSSVSLSGEGLSYQEVAKRLDDAMVALQSKRAVSGSLVEAKKELDNLLEEKEQVVHQIEVQQNLTEQYNELDEKQSLKESIEKQLSIYQAQEKRKQLDELKEKSQQLQKIIEKTQNYNYSYQDLEPFIEENNHLLQKQSEIQQGIKPIEKTVEALGKNPIDEKDFSEFQHLVKIQTQADDLSEFYSNILSPAHIESEVADQKYLAVKKEFAAQSDAMKKIEPNRQEQSTLEVQRDEIQSNLSKLQNRISTQDDLYEQQYQFEQDKFDFAKTRLDDIKLSTSGSSSKPVFLVLGVLIAIVSVSVGYLMEPLAYFGAVLALIFVILFFATRKTSQNLKMIQEAEKQYQTAKESLDKWDDHVQQEKEKLQKELNFLEKNFKENLEKIEKHTLLSSRYSELEGMVKELNSELQYIALDKESKLEKLQNSKERFIEKINNSDKEFQRLIENKNLDLEYIKIALSNIKNEVDEKIKTMLQQKEVESQQEFQQSHLDYQSNEKQRKSLEQMQEKLSQTNKEFVASVSRYSNVDSFAEAYDIFDSLRKNYLEVQELQKELTHLSAGMGLSDYSVEYIQQIISELPDKDSEMDTDDIQKLQGQLTELKRDNILEKMKELSAQIRHPERSLEQIEIEISDVSEEVSEMQRYYDSLEIASQIMEESQAEMRQSFGPMLDQKTGKIFSRITQGKYDNVIINKDYDIKVKSGVQLREAPYLSSGTIDQAYLSLRLAISELISEPGNPLPIFLDDVLIQYDDTRAHLAMKFLSEYSAENGLQIVLFSCHDRMRKLAEEFSVSTSTII